jgi:hypothetical protein
LNDEWERMWKEAIVADLRNYPGICLGTEANHETPQYFRSPRRAFNLGPPEYEIGVLNTRPRRLVFKSIFGEGIYEYVIEATQAT